MAEKRPKSRENWSWPMNENPATPPPADVPGRSPAKFNSPLFLWPAAIVLAVLLYFGLKALTVFFTHESTDDAFIMFLLRFAAALESEEERRDLLLGTFLRENFHMDVFCVMRGGAGLFRLVADLLVAAIDPRIKLGKSDAEHFGDLFMAFHCPDHGACLDAGECRLGDPGLLRNLDQCERFFFAECPDPLS